MATIERTFVRMQQVINTPFRALAVFVVVVLAVIIVINPSQVSTDTSLVSVRV
ncbi:MAG TPA: hypothetical protein VN456_01480 [Desulfosporosinus sp.]|nr:hypothetical protein [Desulfosporosinus sp.]